MLQPLGNEPRFLQPPALALSLYRLNCSFCRWTRPSPVNYSSVHVIWRTTKRTIRNRIRFPATAGIFLFS